MKVDIFNFELPEDRIANEPANPKDSAKLLHIMQNGLENKTIKDLPELLRPDDILVFNNTKVIPARLYGQRGDAKVEVTLYHPVDGLSWWAFIKKFNFHYQLSYNIKLCSSYITSSVFYQLFCKYSFIL